MIFTNRAEWLEWRRGGIGASDIAAILGLSPWASPWSVWAEKVGLIDISDDDQNELQEAGQWLELAIGPWVEARTGLRLQSEQNALVHPQFEWAICTLDGELYDDGGQVAPLGNLEIKTAWPGKAWDEAPVHYEAQCLWQQFVGGYERTYLAVLMGRRLDIHIIERDDDEIAFMLEQAEKFWQDHVVTGDPPPVDGSDATTAALVEVYGSADSDSTIDLDDDLVALVEQYRDAKATERDTSGYVQEIGNRLRAALADHEIGTADGQKVVSWKEQARTTVNGKALLAAAIEARDQLQAVVDLLEPEQYRQRSTTRVLRLHTPKETT